MPIMPAMPRCNQLHPFATAPSWIVPLAVHGRLIVDRLIVDRRSILLDWTTPFIISFLPVLAPSLLFSGRNNNEFTDCDVVIVTTDKKINEHFLS